MTTPRMLFVDPGDEHVGLAKFALHPDGNWFCDSAFELAPVAAATVLSKIVSNTRLDVFGWERFRLFPHLAQAQIGSEFETSQLIGVMKYLVRTAGHPNLQVVVQDPSVQPVAEAVAKKRGIPLFSVTKGRGAHAKSAELHGIYYIASNKMPLGKITDRIEE